MRPSLTRGLIVAVIHVAIVGALGVKLMIDRATRPRVWARTAPVDPDLPIRGRYVRLRIEAAAGEGLELPPASAVEPGVSHALGVALTAHEGRLVAVPARSVSALLAGPARRGDQTVVLLDRPIAFFIPEHAADPSRRLPGEELWVEVTLPRAGLPRPIRLGVRKDGVLTPLP